MRQDASRFSEDDYFKTISIQETYAAQLGSIPAEIRGVTKPLATAFLISGKLHVIVLASEGPIEQLPERLLKVVAETGSGLVARYHEASESFRRDGGPILAAMVGTECAHQTALDFVCLTAAAFAKLAGTNGGVLDEDVVRRNWPRLVACFKDIGRPDMQATLSSMLGEVSRAAVQTGQSRDAKGQSNTLPESTGESQREFLAPDLQKAILKALDGRALKVEDIADDCRVEHPRLYKPNGIRELEAAGLVKKASHGLGYYRPDAPPKDRMLKAPKPDGTN